QAFVVHLEALALQQDVQAPVAEASALMGQGTQPIPQLCISRPPATIPYRHPNAPDGSARPPLAHVERSTQVSDSLSLGGGRHHFFASRSFSAAFSLSSPFSRLASDTSSPPYLAFQL